MKLPAVSLLVLSLAVDTISGTRLRRAALAAAHQTAELFGENKAATQFFKSYLGGLPKNLTKAKQEAVIASLEKEVGKLNENVLKIKDIEKKEAASKKDSEQLKASLKGKDKAMMDSMDKWSSRMNEKAKVGAMNVMSKLKNAIHLIKKGALNGNTDTEAKLTGVL